jgi:hypothetical protein
MLLNGDLNMFMSRNYLILLYLLIEGDQKGKSSLSTT